MLEMDLSTPRSNKTPDPCEATAMGGWQVGDVAELYGLLAVGYNGKIVTLVSWDSWKKRWQCRLDVNGALFQFKPGNLKVPSPSKPVNLKVPSPSSRVGAHRHEDAACKLWTMGWQTEGIAYDRNHMVIFDQIAEKLQRDGHYIPRKCIFDCVRLKNYAIDPLHFRNCTGRNEMIFESVWKHRNIGDIAKRFEDEYNKFNRTRVPGAEFVAVFYCKSGCHRSVATARGLKAWLVEVKKNPNVKIYHKEEKQHQNRFCHSRCEFCQDGDGPDRAKWEKNLVLKALAR